MNKQFLILLIVGILFFLPNISGAVPRQEKSRAEKWVEDIDQLASELPRRHKNLFHTRSQADFNSDIRELKQSVSVMSDEAVIFALSRIVAAFGDSHTTLGYRPRIAFPLTFYWFKEGIFCINILPEYRPALDCRLVAIANKPIDRIIQTLALAIPHENQSQLKKSIPGYLVFADMLYGAGIIADSKTEVFTFENNQGKRFELELPSISLTSKFQPITSTKPDAPLPLYRKYQGAIYDFEYLPQQKTLYVIYNSCRIRKDKPFPDFVKEVFAAVDQNPVERFIIDIRNNGGGNSAIFAPMLKELKERSYLNSKNRLYVILGRRTFSSAVLNAIELRNKTEAIFVGEPTGGKPNHYGEVKTFMLKNSRLPVTYSTKYFTISKMDTDSFYPDIPVVLSFKDFLNNRDPVLERILGIE
jgi:hypothetical protein